MRQAKIKKYIRKEMIKIDGFHRTKEGTGCYSRDFTTECTFLEFGIANDNDGSYTVAIVEFEDGTVDSVLLENIKFTS